MVLDELVLENLGAYAGRQRMELTPPSDDKPIILVGGLNGVGKTTILNALRLALHGQRAKLHRRRRYADYLRGLIHRNADPKQGAAVELKFRYWSEATCHTCRVVRCWKVENKEVKERLEVLRNGLKDDVLSEGWPRLVEEFIPSRIAPLFFFDGEKIETLADPDKSSKVLSEAIHSLLGLDLLKQLATDLRVLERRKRKALVSKEGRASIESLEEEIRSLRDEHEGLSRELIQIESRVEQTREQLHEVEERYRDEGGKAYEQRAQLEAEKEHLEERIAHVEDQLREEAAGPAPLLLVQDLLKSAIEQDRREEAAAEAESVCKILDKRDARTLELAEESGVPSEAIQSVGAFLESDRMRYAEEAKTERYLNLTPDGRQRMRALPSILKDVAARARKLVDRLEKLQDQLVDVERKLNSIPDADTLEDIIRERGNLQQEYSDLKIKKKSLQAEEERLSRRIEERQTKISRQLEGQVKAEYRHQDLESMISYSEKARESIDRYRESLLRRNLGRLEGFILESFQQLLAKKNFVRSLRIDPETFRIDLRDIDGRSLSATGLSAGERQLLAVSLVWGLARSSGRSLPTVIDTPLGRLDSRHRAHLVQRYFPFAAHQVILLSTDEEIDDRYLDGLKPFLGRSYVLKYDDAENATSIVGGTYFEEALFLSDSDTIGLSGGVD